MLDNLANIILTLVAIVEKIMYKQRKIGDIKMSLVQGHLETFLSS